MAGKHATLSYVSSDAAIPHDELIDVTKPGREETRTKGLRAVMHLGGASLLANSWLNRGTNFTLEERRNLHIEGLLPPNYEPLELQAERVMNQLSGSNLRPLNKYNILKETMMLNNTLFYKVLIDNIADLAPIVYTPTVGEACQRYDCIYREPLGMYMSGFQHKGRFAEVLRNWPSKAVQIIVVTDGSRILGLGDLGTNGMGIPVGKISLFVGAGGFHPEHSLPLLIDVGTNNEELLKDKFYMGEKQRRLADDAYWPIIDELCDAVKELWPHALLQFEDFATAHAFGILKRRRHKQLCFNDDIQGTGAVVTAGIMNGLKLQKTDLQKARILFYGAGSSAVGVAEALAACFEAQGEVPRETARKSIFMVDSKGLVYTGRGDELPEHKKIFALDDAAMEELVGTFENEEEKKKRVEELKDLTAVIAAVQPHALVGLSGAGPSWSQEAIEELCRSQVQRPLIFPLSNPTDKAEITARNAYEWSHGSAVFASGSPFKPVKLRLGSSRSTSCLGDQEHDYYGKEDGSDSVVFTPGQANNVFIFPGVGFGSVMAKSKQVSDGMFTAAARALSETVSDEQLEAGQLYPAMKDLRKVSAVVAAAVAEAAFKECLSELEGEPEEGWKEYVVRKMWCPERRDETYSDWDG